MMPRRPTEESMLVKAYAIEHGCTVQWARRERKKNSQGWQSFLAARRGNPVSDVRSAESVAFEPKPDTGELERARLSKESAWQALQQATAIAQNYAGDDVATLAALNRAVREARKTYEDASKYEKMQAIEARRWVPIAKVEGMRCALPQLTEVVQNFRTSIAGKMPAEMRQAFYAAFDACRPGWNEGIRRVDDYLTTLLPSG